MFLPKLNFGSTALILKIELCACITLLLIVHKCDCGLVLEWFLYWIGNRLLTWTWSLVVPVCLYGPSDQLNFALGRWGKRKPTPLPQIKALKSQVGQEVCCLSPLCSWRWKEKADVNAKRLRNYLELGSNKGCFLFPFFFLKQQVKTVNTGSNSVCILVQFTGCLLELPSLVSAPEILVL